MDWIAELFTGQTLVGIPPTGDFVPRRTLHQTKRAEVLAARNDILNVDSRTRHMIAMVIARCAVSLTRSSYRFNNTGG